MPMTPSASDKLTPLVQQFRDAKAEVPVDAICETSTKESSHAEDDAARF